METLFLICAVVGGTVLACQFVMTVLGLGGDDGFGGETEHGFGGDVSHDVSGDAGGGHQDGGDHHNSTWIFGVITLRTIVAALTFFGLAGMAARRSDFEPVTTLLIAVAAGLAAMYGVHWMMQGMHRLRADGTERIGYSVGKPGVVYVPIPAKRAGAGKIHLTLQGRTVEYQAMTAGDEKLKTGSTIVVVGVLGSDLVEVEPVGEPLQVSTHA